MQPPDTPSAAAARPFRVLPAVGADNEHFWPAAPRASCASCAATPAATGSTRRRPICPECLGRQLSAPRRSSGDAAVHTFTVNWQPWYPGPRPALRRRHRRAARAGGAAADHQHRRLRARRRAHRHAGRGSRSSSTTACGCPFFEPAAGRRDGEPSRSASARRSSPASASRQIGRRIYRDPLDLTVEACLAAIEDAGLTRDDIDGLATYPGNMDDPARVLRRRHHRGPGRAAPRTSTGSPAASSSPGQLGSVVNAVAAVAAGLANHVLCFRTVWEASAQGDQGRAVGHHGRGRRRRATGPTGFMQWTLPYGAPSAANWIGMMAQRHFHEFGTTREQLGQIALNGRRNAALQPERDLPRPDDARRLPVASAWSRRRSCLYDCDVPADGSTAS